MVLPFAHPVSVGALLLLATLFSFTNGAKDGANALATIVTSHSMSPRLALLMVCLAEFAGPFIFGVAVAQTVGASIVEPTSITLAVVLAALASANLWNFLLERLGLPSSSTHALIGGLIGAVLTATSFDLGSLKSPGLIQVAIGLFLSPVIALLVGFLVMKVVMFLLRPATPRVNWFFVHGQALTTLGLAMSNGANDAPKAMGMISLGMVAAGAFHAFQTPLWVVLLSAAAIAVGTLFGGQNTVRTIGTRFYRVRPLEAFNSQFSAGFILILASLLGSPVSTSQLVSSAIVGVGGAQRLSKVRWTVMGSIVVGWIFTIPATAVAGGLVYLLIGGWIGR